MTERHPPLRDPHLEEVAQWHPIEGTPTKKKVAVGCSIGATPTERTGALTSDTSRQQQGVRGETAGGPAAPPAAGLRPKVPSRQIV